MLDGMEAKYHVPQDKFPPIAIPRSPRQLMEASENLKKVLGLTEDHPNSKAIDELTKAAISASTQRDYAFRHVRSLQEHINALM